MSQQCGGEREGISQAFGSVHEEILFIEKRDYIRPLRREKRHDSWSSPRWSVRVQNNQPCGCLKDHSVKGYDSLQKPG